MTDRDQPAGQHDCGDDVAAYALGALDPEAAEALERHLTACAVCRDELAAFEAVVNLLPMSAPAQPAPPALRRRVLHAVADEPAGGTEPRRWSWPRLGRLPVPAMALGAILTVAVIVFGVLSLTRGSSPAARVIQAQVAGHGTAQLRLAGNRGELILHGFSPPPAGEIYEVWLQRAGRPPSPTTALFSVTAAGYGNVDVPGDLRGVSLVMVTPEPAGGTPKPTHPAVLQARLT